jgi:leucyl aminopeptidase
MGLELELVTAAAAPSDIAVWGIPVGITDAGPQVLAGLPDEVGGVSLPGSIDPEWCRARGFTAKAGKAATLGSPDGGPTIVLLGVGPVAAVREETWRRASATFVRQAGESGTGALVLPGPSPARGGQDGDGQDGDGPDGDGGEGSGDPTVAAVSLASAVAEGALLASYRFDQFKTSPGPGSIDRLVLVCADGDPRLDDLRRGVARGTATAAAVAWARDLINTPPSDLPPRRFAELAAEELGRHAGVEVAVWDEVRIAEERLGGLLGVSRGSAEPPRLVRADYQPADPVQAEGKVPHVLLVGKGITFDSGGLSLKSAEGMTTMKTDMSGAAIVLGALRACDELGVRVRVTALAPITENMPGGRAIKPGDVLRIRDGKTIEVLNTDAEGRLVLADALVLATELEPDIIVDVATLTGAAPVALGNGIAALFGNDDELIGRLRHLGERTGERLWQLPLPEEYADHIDSEVADMKNIGKPGQAGAIAAALLLQRFVGDTPWAHLDIAGTGRSAESSGYLSKGGTAFGVRTLLALLEDYSGG